MMSGRSEEIALVTGGSRGIGRAVALQLAKDGYDISFCYRRATDAALEVEREILQLGRHVYQQQCDVADLTAVRAFVQATEEKLGPPEVVINSAGIIKDNPLVLMEEESWQAVIATNLDGVFNVCRSTVFNLMKRKSGCIINISSVAGVYGYATQTNYSASKAGVIGFSKALAKELGAMGVRVNVVAPGAIETEIIKDVDPKMMEKIIASIPLRRIGQAQEVADLISFLVSKRASYITGQVIQVDGGIVI
jgi:3-oxoacyl-[acyl-carrier protein] reductase